MGRRLVHAAVIAATGGAAGIVLFAALAYVWLCFAPDRKNIL